MSMKRLLATFLILFGALLTAPSPSAAVDFRDGLQALKNGDNETAIVIFRELAKRDNRDAEFMMGVMYENGYGVGKNDATAAGWYLKAAEAGLASAQYNLGVYYQVGRGVRKSAAEAVRWFSLAARQGHAAAQNNLATYYLTGEGIDKDPVEAWKWYDLAAKGLDGEPKKRVLANRNRVAETLTPDQLAAAKRRVADFHPEKR